MSHFFHTEEPKKIKENIENFAFLRYLPFSFLQTQRFPVHVLVSVRKPLSLCWLVTVKKELVGEWAQQRLSKWQLNDHLLS